MSYDRHLTIIQTLLILKTTLYYDYIKLSFNNLNYSTKKIFDFSNFKPLLNDCKLSTS